MPILRTSRRRVLLVLGICLLQAALALGAWTQRAERDRRCAALGELYGQSRGRPSDALINDIIEAGCTVPGESFLD